MRKFIAVCLLMFSGLAHADCFDDAANHYRVNQLVLRALGKNESNFNPSAFHRNSNGSVDVGLMQINSVHFAELRKYGITVKDLYKSCNSIYIGAWYLRKMINQYGNGMKAIAMYNPGDPDYADRIIAIAKEIRTEQRIALEQLALEKMKHYARKVQEMVSLE